MREETPVIRIGLCLAGAVSAGAYTAGVVDYLLETLERWERAKKLFPDDRRIPRHRVEIEVITGASAGGISGGFLILQAHKKFDVFGNDGQTLNSKWYETESIQYDAWVNLTEGRDNANPMMQQLLSSRDICFTSPSSLLSSQFIDDLTDKFINKTKGYESENLKGKKYLSDDLEFATSLTNIDGIETEIEFNQIGGKPAPGQVHPYKMKSAKDFGHFQLSSVENNVVVEPGLSRIPLCINHGDGNKQLFGNVLQATGAFPIGFAPRKITRKGKYIKSNPLITGGITLKQLNNNDDYSHWMVDGGAVNNEPFETAAFLLERKYQERLWSIKKHSPFEYSKTVTQGAGDFVVRNKDGKVKKDNSVEDINDKSFQTVLMIDPFPNTDSLVEINSKVKKLSIIGSALKLLGALRHQPLVKPVTVDKAVGLSDYSRFMLAPRRKKFDEDGMLVKQIDGSDAIACGALGGFSGFLDRDYREHDYLLGRFNCQHFIQKLFGFRQNDLIGSVLGNTYNPIEQRNLINNGIYPFIPDLLIDDNGVTLNQMNDYVSEMHPRAPVYPEFPSKSLGSVRDSFLQWNELSRKRLKKIAISLLSKQGVPRFLTSFIFKYYWKFKLKDELNELVLSELDSHGLMKK